MGPKLLLYAVLLANTISMVLAFAQLECTPSVSMRPTRNGKPSNCAKALIEGFLSGPTVGEFHRGREWNDFLLPKTKVVGDCQVTVDVNRVERVQGSWQEIWTLANALITACTYFRVSGDASTSVTGGSVRGGQGNGLSITMKKPPEMAIEEPTIAAG